MKSKKNCNFNNIKNEKLNQIKKHLFIYRNSIVEKISRSMFHQ